MTAYVSMKIDKMLQLLKGKTAKNGIWIIVERLVSVGLTTIVTVMSARYLGAAEYGILSYGASFVTLFLGLMKLGLDTILVNEVIKNRHCEGEILGTSIILRFASSIISMIAIFFLVTLLNSNSPLLVSVAMIQATMLVFQVFYVFDYWFQSHLNSKYVSIAKATASILVFIYSLYLLFSGKSLIWFAFSLSIGSLIIALLLSIFYKRAKGQKLKYSTATAKYLLSQSHHFIVASVIVSIYVQVDKIMIVAFLEEKQLGLYSAALIICTAWIFLPDAIATSIRPSIFKAKGRSEQDYIRLLKQLYFIVFWTSLVISATISACAPWIVNLLFGEEYLDTANVLRIMIWFVPLSVLGSTRSIWIVGENKGKFTKYYLIIGVVCTIALNFILLPSMGITGAAIVRIVTEFLTCFIAPLFYPATRKHTKIAIEAIFYRL